MKTILVLLVCLGVAGAAKAQTAVATRFPASPTSLKPGVMNSLVQLDLGAGDWVVTAKVNFVNDSFQANQIVCQLNGVYAEQSSVFLAALDARNEVTLILLQTSSSAKSTVEVACSPDGDARAFLGTIVAQQMTNLTVF